MSDDKIGERFDGLDKKMRCTDRVVPSPSVVADKLRQRQIRRAIRR